MNLFELLVLNKLYPGMFSGCLPLLGLLLLTCGIAWIIEKIQIHLFGVLIFIGVILILGIIFTISYKKYEKEQSDKQEQRKQKLKALAEKYINDTITQEKFELEQEDYKKFYKIVLENNIDIKNSNAVDVPYDVRSILYDAYLNKYNELPKLYEEETELEQEKNKKEQEIFKDFANMIQPYITDYIKTILPEDELPAQINQHFEEDEISAFLYLLENEYNIEIPYLKHITYDTLFLSENILQSLRNIVRFYCSNDKYENKLCLIDFLLSYNYAIEVYNLFENKLTAVSNTEEKSIKNLIQSYVFLFNDNLTYVDLLLEYIQKYNIELPKPTEENFVGIGKALYVYNKNLKDNFIFNTLFDKDRNIDAEEVLNCSEPNWKYLWLICLVIEEFELSKIRRKAEKIKTNIFKKTNRKNNSADGK